ncbi:MAG TPA: phosphohydrolase [Candidatus Rokubacteria bacterium]|nr:phosphohydrolase [Candidatus Rokubacteria bacterium]
MTDSYIVTYTGRRFPYGGEIPDSAISLTDIALALSRICRFGGHIESLYTVAQHSVLVSRWCNPKHALDGLLHDAAEAYVGDLVAPLKHTDAAAGLRELEVRIHAAIARKFGVYPVLPMDVVLADRAVYAAEVRNLFPSYQRVERLRWGGPEPIPEIIVPISPEAARAAFLLRFVELMGHRVERER